MHSSADVSEIPQQATEVDDCQIIFMVNKNSFREFCHSWVGKHIKVCNHEPPNATLYTQDQEGQIRPAANV